MTDPRDRDDSMDRLLRQALEPSAPRHAEAAPECLDAETIAAWMDGGLSGSALVAAEAHAATCARCGAVLAAMARSTDPAAESTEAAAPPVTPVAPAPTAGRRWWPWLVPLAAAAVVIIAVALPRRPSPEFESAAAKIGEEAAPSLLRQARPEKPAADAAATPPAAAPIDAARIDALKDAARIDALKSDAERKREAPQAKAVAVSPAAAPAATADRVAGAKPAEPAAPPATQALGAARALESVASRIGPIEIPTPRAGTRWRVTGGVVARTTDSGATWQDIPVGIAADFTAGSAPSADVCWLIGRAGIVMLTIDDGRTWRRLAFLDATDLSAIAATDARTATVTTADGRVFVTNDAGNTWVRRPVQGNPPAPFYQ